LRRRLLMIRGSIAAATEIRPASGAPCLINDVSRGAALVWSSSRRSWPARTQLSSKTPHGTSSDPLLRSPISIVELTELGKLVLPRLEEILSAADDARRSAEDFRKRKETPLKIGLSTSVSAALLGAIAPKIVALHPALQIDVVEAPTADLLTLLFEG